jgi:hypothetical protein
MGGLEPDDKRINGGDEDEKFAGRFVKEKNAKLELSRERETQIERG